MAAAAVDEPLIGALLLNDPPHPARDLRWTDGDGAPRRLADYAGRGVILNFWATWCGPCVAEMPSLAGLARALQSAPRPADAIAVIPISTDSGGAAVVRQFYRSHGIAGLGVWLDPKATALAGADAVGLPTTLIIDRAGREVGRIAGAADWAGAGTLQTLRVLCGQ